MTALALRGDLEQFRDAYVTLKNRDTRAMPARLAAEANRIRARMESAYTRAVKAGHFADSQKEVAQGLGFVPLIPLVLLGTSAGVGYWIKSATTEADEFNQRADWADRLLDAGVSPDRVADIVLGKPKMATTSVIMYTAGATALGIWGFNLWKKRKK